LGQPINIHTKDAAVQLEAGTYRIYMLGGFGVKLGHFTIVLKNQESGTLVDVQKAFWPVQAYGNGKRAKRIFIAEAPAAGVYQVIFNNPTDVKVSPTGFNLPLHKFLLTTLLGFDDSIANASLEVLITKSLGINPFLR